MKKIILLIIVGLSFLSFPELRAQSLAGVKICVNPGHGGHDSNDREIPLAPGVTFWESDGNLSKGIYLREILQGLGATVIMTRTTNTTADDLPLSQIVAIANANNVDYFQSIHSNAGGGAANYTLILFQGRTTAPTYPGALSMANYLADEIYRVDRTTSKMIYGDFDFYGTGQAYLGVFKGLNMPGTLTEGSMHDYTPESWRLKNESYLKHEAWAIARAYLPYFLGGTFPTGIVAGILRDKLETVPDSYHPIGNDKYKPLNQIKVRMEPGGRIYNGDNYNNGFYLFDNVVPGNYKLFFEAENMKTDSASVLVYADESVFADLYRTYFYTTRTELKLLSTYPAAGSSDISTSVLMNLKFDKGIIGSTLANRITFKGSDGKDVPLQVNQDNYNIGIIEFEPRTPLDNNALYTITLKAGIEDTEHLTLLKDSVITFTTEKNYTFTGNILEGFETLNAWLYPLLSAGTTGINSDQTSFALYSSRKKSGSYSGKLEYGFSGSNGVVDLSLLNPIELGESSQAGFGIWVFGDNSNNILQYRFSRNNSVDEIVTIDTVDWTGWKLKKVWLNDIPGAGTIQFKSIDLVQSAAGSASGKLFFDDCIANIITGVKENTNPPAEFRLQQNYPNPFNPSTKIKFSIPGTNSGKAVATILKVYDLLGREVAVLVNEEKLPGNYEVLFDAKNLTSGIYLYTIRAGNFTATRKLLLLK